MSGLALRCLPPRMDNSVRPLDHNHNGKSLNVSASSCIWLAQSSIVCECLTMPSRAEHKYECVAKAHLMDFLYAISIDPLAAIAADKLLLAGDIVLRTSMRATFISALFSHSPRKRSHAYALGHDIDHNSGKTTIDKACMVQLFRQTTF